ncbi:MAG: CoA transferase [Chloroflexi bacterium]|nr:CoA transferase [Chloroflexota bacterium]
MKQCLEGIKVLELAAFAFGPRVATHLGDMGADVIKLEHPGGGDPSRALTSLRGLPVGKFNYYFEMSNHNKKSVAIDLTHPEGREIGYKLVSQADVLVTNFQVTALQKLGMDYETISKMNKKIVYALGTGWGLKGPDKDLQAFDFVVAARSGLLTAFAQPGTPPVAFVPAFGDHITALALAYGIMLALFHRERTGEGQMVHMSLLGGLNEANALSVSGAIATGEDIPRTSRKQVVNALWNQYECKDGNWIQLAMGQTDRFWHDFCPAMGLEQIEKDPRFDSHASRTKNNEALIALLDKTFSTRTRDEWIALFRDRNIIWGPVKTILEATQDPQLWENSNLVHYDHPAEGRIKMVGPPVQLSKTPGSIRMPGPVIGQHTEEVLLSLGYSWDDIGRLKKAKTVI